MASINISLTDSLKEFVEKRVKDSDFSTPSDYIRSLIRGDRLHAEEALVQSLLLQGIASGAAQKMSPREWRSLWQSAEAKPHKNRRSKRL